MIQRAAVFLLFAIAPAFAQLSLYTVQDGVETPVGEAFDFGSVAAGWNSSDVVFRLRYTGNASPYYLNYFLFAVRDAVLRTRDRLAAAADARSDPCRRP